MRRLTATAAILVWLAAASTAVAAEFRNEIGMTFVLLPAGTFTMGSPMDEPARDQDETEHQVTITRPYYMQTTEVTQGQWQQIMGSNPSHFADCGADCPVETVSWFEVQDFIKALNQRTGSNYRLPSEAEFEYGARAGSNTAFANGPITKTACDFDPALDAIGWYCYNAGDSVHPVARKQPNAWGLYDMHGNLWEWCADSWDGSPYAPGPVVDPLSLSPSADGNRVIRSGGWATDAWFVRSANRDWCKPHYRNDFLGFRLVLPVAAEGHPGGKE